jgi:hypothetical protein
MIIREHVHEGHICSICYNGGYEDAMAEYTTAIHEVTGEDFNVFPASVAALITSLKLQLLNKILEGEENGNDD